MPATIITNIKQLVNTRQHNKLLRGKELAELPCIENAYLVIENGIIAEYGDMDKLGWADNNNDELIDATGQIVMPTWCDSHTHLVFAASREEEFVDKINGISYAEIAAKTSLAPRTVYNLMYEAIRHLRENMTSLPPLVYH